MNSCGNEGKKILKACKDIVLPGSNGVMPIAGYYGPHRPTPVCGYITVDTVQEDCFQMLEDAGINLICYTECRYSNQPDEMHDILELAGRHNIGVFMWDDRINNDTTEEELERYVADYADYKAFVGLRVTDEPSAEYFPDVSVAGWEHIPERRLLSLFAKTSQLINGYDNMMGYTNLLPWSSYMRCPLENYERYVREFCETYSPKILSMDHYVINGTHDENQDNVDLAYSEYFQNLCVIYKCSKEYNIPFWAFIQAGGNWFAGGAEVVKYYPDAAETLWLVNSSLAFGAKGIQYYPLLQVHYSGFRKDHTIDTERGGIIAPDGLPSRYWFYARTANMQVQVVDEILLECEAEGLIATGYAAKITEKCDCFFENKSFRELKAVESGEQGTIIGCFDYHGKTALYVVNNDMITMQQINLLFDGEHTYSMLALGCDKKQTSDRCELKLAPGAAVLLVVE